MPRQIEHFIGKVQARHVPYDAASRTRAPLRPAYTSAREFGDADAKIDL